MGILSFRIKSFFLDLFKCLNSLNWLIVFLSIINLSVCIYEDQIGKFDWRQSYVGRIKFAHFDTVSTAKKIIVATEENVLAALHLKTGEIVWRHVFESSSVGDIQLLHVSDKIHTVSGSNPYLVRGWDTSTGVLLWEWSLTLKTETPELSEWWIQHGLLVHMLPVVKSHIEVTTYNVMTGQSRGVTSKLPASWVNKGCVTSPPYYSCLSDSDLLLSLDVTANAMQVISKPISEVVGTGVINKYLRPLDVNNDAPAFIVEDKTLVLIKENGFESMKLPQDGRQSSLALVKTSDGPVLLQTRHNDEQVSVEAFSIPSMSPAREWVGAGAGAEAEAEAEAGAGAGAGARSAPAALLCASCAGAGACRMLLQHQDNQATLLRGGQIMWRREESLANVVAAKMVDLPVSEEDAAIETEFAHQGGSILSAFYRRLETQYSQLRSLVQSLSQPHGTDESTALVRDYFNLHKIIVVVTDVCKLFGIDSVSGAVVWRRAVGGCAGAALHERRPPRRDHLATLSVLGHDQVTGNGIIISVNPITGDLIEEGILRLDTKILQSALLHKEDEDHLHALILLDADENVLVFPKSAERLVENMYMFVADKETTVMTGYALKYDGRQVNAIKTWKVQLSGGELGHKIVALSTKRSDEKIYSPGRVLADRSVLYKYLNPNLAAVLTQGPQGTEKETVTATVVDVVSGHVVTSQSHRRARALPFILMADNMLMYAVYNEKHRRTDIATLEMYEGPSRWWSGEVPFTSLWYQPAALVSRQSYVFPAARTAALTATQRSLADTHALVALTSGSIVEVPWAFLDPRRPLTPSEEGLPPYTPELPTPAENVINYNQSLPRVAHIYTAPSGLESTCLVLVTGLDLFYTRVAPSKTFDLLKEDFDYYVIASVLAGLVATAVITSRFADRKMLNNAWK